MNEETKYALGGIIVGGFLVWLAMTSSINSNRTSQNTTQNSDILDAHFIEQMIPHHEDAITMAKLAITKAVRTEVRQLAENIIASQGKEISQMKDWYKSWFGEEVPSGIRTMNQHGMMGGSSMHMGMMGDTTDITRLENAKDFDREFVEEMIPHHQMAVMMANMLKNGTQRVEMKKLANDIITAQTKEINQMRGWYSDWEYSK
jgi:uncharacterized protein (DUF305 family)